MVREYLGMSQSTGSDASDCPEVRTVFLIVTGHRQHVRPARESNPVTLLRTESSIDPARRRGPKGPNRD